MPLFGPPNVEKLKAKGNVKGLIKALGYEKERYVRRAAARALGEIADPQSVEPLLVSLKRDSFARADVAEALGKIGDERAVKPLVVVALKDAIRGVREAAATALVQIGGERAVEPFIVALKDRYVREAAATILDELGWQPDRSETGATYWIVKREWDRCVEIGAPAVEPLIVALKDRHVRRAAAEALGKIGDERAVEPLIVALVGTRYRGEKHYVRRAAAEALGKIGDPRAVEPLIAALKDKEQQVRRAATDALRQIGDPRAVAPLIAALKDKDVCMIAAEALDKLDWQPENDEIGATYWIVKRKWGQCIEIGKHAIMPLVGVLRDNDHNVRRCAAGALGQIGARLGDPVLLEPAVAPLIARLKDREWDVRQAATWALGQIGNTEAVKPLINIALRDENESVCRDARDALVNVGLLEVAAILKDDDSAVCLAAAEALGQIGDARAVEPLIVALKDEDSDVRRAAAEALDGLGWQPDRGEAGAAYWAACREWDKCVEIGTPAVEPLIAALEGEDSAVRRAAAGALVRIGTPAVKPLIIALKNEDSAVRRAAAEALGQIGNPQAVEPLIVALKDKDSDVREAAAEALDKLDWQPDKSEAGLVYWIVKRKWSKCIEIGTLSVNPLLAILKDRDQKRYWRGVAKALGQIGDVRAVAPLIALLKDKDDDVRQAAAEALRRIGDVHAVKRLVIALKDRDENVRQAAAKALVEIGASAVRPAVETLIIGLDSYRGGERRVAARALVHIYKQEGLDSTCKQLILAERHRIMQHTDSHRDASTGIGHHHSDHTDKGIGIKFPL